MAKKTLNEIIEAMRENIRSSRPTVTTEEGSVVRDLFINTPSAEIEEIYVESERNTLINSFYYYNLMTDDELESLAYNYSITRKAATRATGTVTFYKNSAPTSDIIIPFGTEVSTQKDNQLNATSFLTTIEKTMSASQAASYYNSTTGRYEIDVTIEAENSGTAGNVGANSIIVISSGLSGMDGVNNSSSLSNGTDRESNQALASRCLDALAGNNVGTRYGYRITVTSYDYVQDAVVVAPEDTDSVRDGVDIYVKFDKNNSNTFSQDAYSFEYTDLSGGNGATDTLNDILLENRPVKEIVSVTGSISGTFQSGVDYDLSLDTESVYQGSITANDKIKWLLDSPQEGETITIDYVYYSLIQEIENYLDSERIKIITADVLVKLAEQIDINVEIDIYADDTISSISDFADEVQTAIETFIRSETLANKVEQSDIVSYLYNNVDGVDRITLPFTALNAPSKSEYATGANDMEFASNEYSWDGTITVNAFSS